MKKKKENRGGARKGAGRPKKEDTKVIRVPVSKVKEIKHLISPDDIDEEPILNND